MYKNRDSHTNLFSNKKIREMNALDEVTGKMIGQTPSMIRLLSLLTVYSSEGVFGEYYQHSQVMTYVPVEDLARTINQKNRAIEYVFSVDYKGQEIIKWNEMD